MSANRIYRQKLSVAFDFPVVFTRDAFRPSNTALLKAMTRLGERRVHRAAIFIDAGVARGHPTLAREVTGYFRAHATRLKLVAPPQLVPGGETAKNDLARVAAIMRRLLQWRLCRHSFVIVIGGGAVLDTVGFAASLVHRGLRLIRFPTTVLAQDDSGVGVKTAVNFADGKNLVGTFAPPFAVINDEAFLDTLSDADWRGGVAEAFKVAIIKDAVFFRWLCRNAARLRRRDPAAMRRLIRRSAELHLDHIRTSGDPFEFGQARPLDFGHWSAHKLEALSRYRVGHGQAVAIGLALDACYAARKGWLREADCLAIHRGLGECGFTLWHPLLERKTVDGKLEVLGGLRDFQEHLGGELFITFPKGIGRKFEVQEIDAKLVAACVRGLKRNVTT